MIWLGQHLSKQSVGLIEVRGGRHPASILLPFLPHFFFFWFELDGLLEVDV